MSAGDAPAAAPAPIARLKDELASLERAYSPGHHGLWSARRRAELVDVALVELYRASNPAGARAPRTALVALGGYGRGALVPRSDIDLLLLHDGTESGVVAGLTERLLYPLWDAGFTVGHAVRTPAESVALATDRLDAATAVLDARLLAGDAELLRRGRGGPRPRACRPGHVRRRFGERRPGTARALRLHRLPVGAGIEGRRGWAPRHPCVRLAPEGPWPTARGRRAPPGSERGQLDAAEEFLTRVRSALHLTSGRASDRLLRDQQDEIAGVMGFQDEPRLMAADGLMRAIFEHARAVDALTET